MQATSSTVIAQDNKALVRRYLDSTSAKVEQAAKRSGPVG
jgi:hypothetical protein